VSYGVADLSGPDCEALRSALVAGASSCHASCSVGKGVEEGQGCIDRVPKVEMVHHQFQLSNHIVLAPIVGNVEGGAREQSSGG
jgi:hypothetical protein